MSFWGQAIQSTASSQVSLCINSDHASTWPVLPYSMASGFQRDEVEPFSSLQAWAWKFRKLLPQPSPDQKRLQAS